MANYFWSIQNTSLSVPSSSARKCHLSVDRNMPKFAFIQLQRRKSAVKIRWLDYLTLLVPNKGNCSNEIKKKQVIPEIDKPWIAQFPITTKVRHTFKIKKKTSIPVSKYSLYPRISYVKTIKWILTLLVTVWYWCNYF